MPPANPAKPPSAFERLLPMVDAAILTFALSALIAIPPPNVLLTEDSARLLFTIVLTIEAVWPTAAILSSESITIAPPDEPLPGTALPAWLLVKRQPLIISFALLAETPPPRLSE